MKSLQKQIAPGSLLLLSFVVSLTGLGPVALAQDFPGEYSIGGWIWAEYGEGDRYSQAQGEDTLGISEGALLVKWNYQNAEAILLLGGRNLTGDGSDGDFGIKDAYIVWDKIGGSGVSLSAGVQPLFFGLKPNGFPGDRSLQPSIEFGGAGGFAVSQQAGPAVILGFKAGKSATVRAGVFDTSSSTAAYFAETGLGKIDGSSIDKNSFIQLELGNKEGGFYASFGFAERYVGSAIDSSEPILDAGVGYRNGLFDLSFEYVELDRAFTGTLNDETYGIAELTITASEKLSLLLDYAEADEANLETMRAGLVYKITNPLVFHAEYSEDDFGAGGSVDSIDLRLELNF